MFFFFVGGLSQQVSQVLKKDAGRCIACGSTMTDLVEYEKVLKVFFVPVWNWPGKEPLMHCRNCDLFFPPSMSPPLTPGPENRERRAAAVMDVLRCQYCDREIDAQFRFCPFCGSAQ